MNTDTPPSMSESASTMRRSSSAIWITAAWSVMEPKA